MKLAGKVALITGAGSGIGRASAILFAHEGAKVVVGDVVAEEGEETVQIILNHGGNALFVQTDVSKASEVERMIQTAIEIYGRLDILFNNAGVDHPEARSVTETTEALWDYTMNVNLKGVFLVSKLAIPHMIETGGGVIINTASIAGLVGTPNEAAYYASKGGVILLTKQMAIDYARQGIRVNCICPGAMVEMIRDRRVRMDATARLQYAARAEPRYPMGRYGGFEEVAQAALFLASAASSFMTGSALVVDGGFTAQ